MPDGSGIGATLTAGGRVPVYPLALNISFLAQEPAWPEPTHIATLIAIEAPIVLEPRRAAQGSTLGGRRGLWGGVTIGGVALPTGGARQGVAMALLRMAQCRGEALSGDPFDMIQHPMYFGLGGGAGAYARGAIVGNLLVVPIVWAALAWLVVPWLLRQGLRRFSNRPPPSLAACRDIAGWPASMAVPIGLLAEGSMTACVGLLSFTGEAQSRGGDAALAAMGLVVLTAATAAWALALWRLARRVHGHSLLCHRPLDAPPRSQWLVSPRWEWALVRRSTSMSRKPEGGLSEGPLWAADNNDVLMARCPSSATVEGADAPLLGARTSSASMSRPPRDASQALAPSQSLCVRAGYVVSAGSVAHLQRRLFLVGDAWWLWAALAAHLCSLLVGAAEGISASTDAMCRARWVLAAVGALGQAAAALTSSIPLELLLLSGTSLVTAGIVATVAATTFGVASLTDEAVEDAVTALASLSTAFGYTLMAAGVACLGIELWRESQRLAEEEAEEEESEEASTRPLSIDIISASGTVADMDLDLGEISPPPLCEAAPPPPDEATCDQPDPSPRLVVVPPPAAECTYWLEVLEEAQMAADASWWSRRRAAAIRKFD